MLDHSFDHLQSPTTWKQCDGEHPKAPLSDTKAPKSLVNQAKNRYRFVWEQDVAGSNPVIPTKRTQRPLRLLCSFALGGSCLYYGIGSDKRRLCDSSGDEAEEVAGVKCAAHAESCLLFVVFSSLANLDIPFLRHT